MLEINFCIKEWESGTVANNMFEKSKGRAHWQAHMSDLVTFEKVFKQHDLFNHIVIKLVTNGR